MFLLPFFYRKSVFSACNGVPNDRGQKAKNLHVVRESNMPAVLTENLFLDVATDAAKLKKDVVIQAIIDSHVIGIAKYLGLKKKETANQGNNDNKVVVLVNGKKEQVRQLTLQCELES
ncbi:N-acetylmuramoyl-L-alanine amidase [Paenibacillus sp. FSL R5-0470]|uniref:N-acetylmuramoyl-L-alanine amidase n=2 Tax=Paenibacillus sp. FSL R5-0470 TaxID=2921641 RepID=UPI0030D757C8